MDNWARVNQNFSSYTHLVYGKARIPEKLLRFKKSMLLIIQYDEKQTRPE